MQVLYLNNEATFNHYSQLNGFALICLHNWEKKALFRKQANDSNFWSILKF